MATTLLFEDKKVIQRGEMVNFFSAFHIWLTFLLRSVFTGFQKRDFRSCTNATKNKGDETPAGQSSLKLKKIQKKRKTKLNNSTLGRENNHL